MTELTNQVRNDLADPNADNMHDLYHQLASMPGLYGGKDTPAWQQELAAINADPSIQAVLPQGFQIVGTEGDTSGLVPDPTQNGRVVLKNADGAQEYLNLNGTVTNASGQVVEIMYGKGTTKQIGYDESGQVNQVVDKSGSSVISWNRDGDGQWHAVDQNGEPLKGADGNPFGSDAKISVDTTSGDYRIEYPNGNAEIYHQDGSSEIDRADGSKQMRDIQGRTTQLIDANCQVLKFEYNGDTRDPSKITVNDGTPNAVTFEREKDGTFTRKQKGQPDQKGLSGDLVVDNGEGVTVRLNKDGSIVSAGNGRVQIQQANGRSVFVELNEDGQVTRLLDDGHEYEQQEDGSWIDKQTRKSFAVSIVTIDDTGTIFVKQDSGTEVRKTDGTVQWQAVAAPPAPPFPQDY
jgi:hypothetical protein